MHKCPETTVVIDNAQVWEEILEWFFDYHFYYLNEQFGVSRFEDLKNKNFASAIDDLKSIIQTISKQRNQRKGSEMDPESEIVSQFFIQKKRRLDQE